jgi:hypothetical protein
MKSCVLAKIAILQEEGWVEEAEIAKNCLLAVNGNVLSYEIFIL